MPKLILRASCRESRYFAGETLSSKVSFFNECNPDEGASVRLDWATVQVVGQWIVDPKRVKLPSEVTQRVHSVTTTPHKRTSLPDFTMLSSREAIGAAILCSKPFILFCDHLLEPSTHITYEYTAVLPSECPPSIKTGSVKLLYWIVLGCQVRDHKAITLKLPFVVANHMLGTELFTLLPFNEIGDVDPHETAALLPTHKEQHAHNADEGASFGFDNPPCHQLLSCDVASSTGTFVIGTDKHHIVTFCLPKRQYYPGEVVAGTFDFSKSTLTVLQIHARLETEETLVEAYSVESVGAATQTTVWAEASLFTQHALHCHFALPLAFSAPSPVTTDLVAVHWTLSMEITTIQNDAREKLNWKLPLSVNLPYQPRSPLPMAVSMRVEL